MGVGSVHKEIGKLCRVKKISKEITVEKNIEFYKTFMVKHQEGIYAKRPNAMGDKLALRLEIFEQLDVEKQCQVLMQIIGLSSIGITSADLTLIKEAAICGKMLMSKNLKGVKELKLINQSVTGLFESQIDLLTV